MVFDTESTDKDPETASIVTSCLAILRPDGKPKDSWEVLLNCGTPINPAATEVHGITDEMATAGKDPNIVLPQIVDQLAEAMENGTPVVAFNGRFDFTLLDRDCRRRGLKTLSDALGRPLGPVLDPYVMDKAVDQYRKGLRKLKVMCEHYDVELLDWHNATADAIAAGRLAQTLIRQFRGLQLPLNTLHRAQQLWAAQQAASLERYLRRKENDDTITCESAWPLVEFEEADHG